MGDVSPVLSCPSPAADCFYGFCAQLLLSTTFAARHRPGTSLPHFLFFYFLLLLGLLYLLSDIHDTFIRPPSSLSHSIGTIFSVVRSMRSTRSRSRPLTRTHKSMKDEEEGTTTRKKERNYSLVTYKGRADIKKGAQMLLLLPTARQTKEDVHRMLLVHYSHTSGWTTSIVEIVLVFAGL